MAVADILVTFLIGILEVYMFHYEYTGVGHFFAPQKFAQGSAGAPQCYFRVTDAYVFSAMGFYPVNPVSGKYEIGTPLFPEMKLHLANGKTFTVLAPKVSKENIYIQSIKVDGQPYDKTYLTHEQIINGATVEFEMSKTRS